MELTTEYYDEKLGMPIEIDFEKTPVVMVGGKCNNAERSLMVSLLSMPLKNTGLGCLQTIDYSFEIIQTSNNLPGQCASQQGDSHTPFSSLTDFFNRFDTDFEIREIEQALFLALYDLNPLWNPDFESLLTRFVNLPMEFPKVKSYAVLGHSRPLDLKTDRTCLEILFRPIPIDRYSEPPDRSSLIIVAEEFKSHWHTLNRTWLHEKCKIPYDEIGASVAELSRRNLLAKTPEELPSKARLLEEFLDGLRSTSKD